tara:strand:- start:813 stop:1862 length:1050 start_codon:yes stop_codon:yes gene_type:complete
MAYTTITKSTDYFNTKLYTGNASTNAITGVGFQPDMTWLKQRNGTPDHYLYDAIRGVLNYITPNLTTQQQANATSLTAFNSDGFTLGSNAATNVNSGNFASWNWKAGTTGSGTTTGAGTGKAYSYSVNTTSGFSIVKYLGNGTANHTIPHHLGVKPKMIITKNLDSQITWIVGHENIGWDHILFLDSTAAKADDVNAFNDIAPTSTVWNVGTGNGNNSNNVNYVSYCFTDVQGYSKFSSYIGNGNADGTFVYTGFKPAMVILKRTSGAIGDWLIFDDKRNSFNEVDKRLYPNGDYVEESSASSGIDMISNGFKLRGTSANEWNKVNSYIYLAFAAEPLVSTNGIPATAR